MKRAHLGWVGLLAWACTPPKPVPDSGAQVYVSDDPALTGFQMECEPAEGRWRVAVRADAWMGRVRLWMATEPDDLEQHDISLDRAAADASWDCASSTIPMAEDVLDPGSGTRFRCSERSELHILLAVAEATGETWADCRRAGPDDDLPWAEVNGVPACETMLESVFEDSAYTTEEGSVADCP